MKKLLSAFIAISLIFCFCSCKEDNYPDETIEVEYEEIIVSGSSVTNPSDISSTQSDKTDTTNKVSSNTVRDPNVSSVPASKNNKTDNFIDFDNVVEVDICHDIVRTYLSATNAKSQFVWLKDFSGKLYDYQCLSLNWSIDESSEYSVYFSEKSNFDNAIIIKTASSDMKNTYLVPGKTYY